MKTNKVWEKIKLLNNIKKCHIFLKKKLIKMKIIIITQMKVFCFFLIFIYINISSIIFKYLIELIFLFKKKQITCFILKFKKILLCFMVPRIYI